MDRQSKLHELILLISQKHDNAIQFINWHPNVTIDLHEVLGDDLFKIVVYRTIFCLKLALLQTS